MPSATLLGKTLDAATGKLLENDKSPTRAIGGIDNRGSHIYLALYWAAELAAQAEDAGLQARFAPIAKALAENEPTIVAELLAVQGKPVDVGGSYLPDDQKADAALRPSPTFNRLLLTL
jgi:isocitrate dehydrogenase